MLEVWRAADGIDVFESGWTSTLDIISRGRLELGIGAVTDARCSLTRPICIGGSGEKGTLRTAARFAPADIGRDPAEIAAAAAAAQAAGAELDRRHRHHQAGPRRHLGQGPPAPENVAP